ncbi:integrase catalytic domain-containing protein [Trichonephila clavipes]|nr:integrase catalytic domain-containing protein [Trichonephila clavipes]
MVTEDRLYILEHDQVMRTTSELAHRHPNFHAISTRGLCVLTHLTCIKPSTNGVTGILSFVRLFRDAIGSDFVVIDNNENDLTGLLMFSSNWKVKILLEWIGQRSPPDLNPIEHVCDALGRCIGALLHPPGSSVLISTGSVFLRNNEARELKCPVIFDSAETEFGWIAGGRLQETKTNNFSCYLLKDNDSVEDTLKLFFELESFGIKDDPCYRKDDQAMNIFKETVQYNNNRLNRVAISSGIRQAFLQICLVDKHKDFIQDTREESLFMSRQAKNIMKEAGMEMRKWISNDTALMAQWVAEGTLDKKITWEEILPPKLKETWLIWFKELSLLDHLRIQRLVLDSTNDKISRRVIFRGISEYVNLIEIHIFCDASKLAYGAAVYVKVRKQNEVLVNLITSKTRVAPLKAVTLPRLELLKALVAAQLSSRVPEIIRKKKKCKVSHWTDSKIVLFWIKGSSKRWKQFVANRGQEISKLTDLDSWFHCSGQDNPSDFFSRGLSVDTLIPTTSGGKVQPS